MVANTEMQKWPWVKYSILGDQWLTFSYILTGYLKIIINTECLQYLPEVSQQSDKKKVMKIYKELLGTCIKSKKTAYKYIMYQIS